MTTAALICALILILALVAFSAWLVREAWNGESILLGVLAVAILTFTIIWVHNYLLQAVY